MNRAMTLAGTTRTGAAASRWLQRLLWVAWIPLVLYVVFFAPMPDVHDGMHPLRHASTLVQCH